MVHKSSTPSRKASRAAKGRKRRHARSAARLVIGRKTAGNIPNGWDEAKPKDKSQGKDGKDNKKSVMCWDCNAQGHVAKDSPKKKESLSAVESQEQRSSSSDAAGETTLSGFFLNALEESELNSFESKIAGVLVTGIDSGAARSVVLAGEIPGSTVERDSETGRVYTSATGERVFDQGKQQILGTVGGRVRGLKMRLAQVKNSLTSVCDMCAVGHRVVFDFDREDLLQVAKPCVGARSQNHPESENRGHPEKEARAECRGVVSLRGVGTLAVSPIVDPVGSGPVRDGSEREGRGVMAKATGSKMPADHDPACEQGAIRARAVPVGPTRQKMEGHNAAGHVPYRTWCRAHVAGRGRSDAHLTSRSFVSATTTIGIEYGYFKDKMTMGEQEAGPGDDCRCALVLGHSASLVCPGFGASDRGNG